MKLLTIALLLFVAWAELYNFDYKKHGADWEQMAPPDSHWEQCSLSNHCII